MTRASFREIDALAYEVTEVAERSWGRHVHLGGRERARRVGVLAARDQRG